MGYTFERVKQKWVANVEVENLNDWNTCYNYVVMM